MAFREHYYACSLPHCAIITMLPAHYVYYTEAVIQQQKILFTGLLYYKGFEEKSALIFIPLMFGRWLPVFLVIIKKRVIRAMQVL